MGTSFDALWDGPPTKSAPAPPQSGKGGDVLDHLWDTPQASSRVQSESTAVNRPVRTPPPSQKSGSLADVIAQGLGGGPASALADAIVNPTSYQGHFWDNMKASQAGLNQRSADYTARHPVAGTIASTVSGIAPVAAVTALSGGLATPEAIAAKAAPGFLARTVGGAAAGGLAQGASTFVNTPGSPLDRLRGVGNAGLPATGMMLGAAAPAIGSVLGKAFDHATGQAATNSAASAFTSRLKQAGMTPTDLLSAAASAPEDAPVVAADLMGNPGLKLLRKTTDLGGVQAAQLQQQLSDRGIGQLDRTLGNMKEALGQDFQNIPATQEQLVTDMKAKAAPLYAKANAQPLPASVTAEVQRLRTAFPEIEKAFAAGDVLRQGDAALSGIPAQTGSNLIANVSPKILNDPKMMALLQERGALPAGATSTPMTVGDVHYAKLGLDDLIDRKSDGSGIAPTRARQLRIGLSGLLDQVDAAVPDYATARAQYRGDKEIQEAMELGKSAFHLPVDELQMATQDFSPGEQQAFRASAMDQLKQAAGNVDTRKDLMARWLASPNMEARLRLIAPSDEAAQALLGHRDIERQMAATAAAPKAGSNTSTVLSDQIGQGPISGSTIARGFVSPHRFLTSSAGALGQAVQRAWQGQLAENLAPMLGTAREDIPTLVSKLTEAQQAASQRARFGLIGSGALGSRIGIRKDGAQ